jgi:ATP-dependent helicase/nuclease subunit B
MRQAPPERSRSNVLTVPSGVPFLDVLAEYLLDGGLVAGPPLRNDPLGLMDARIYLPTRRAARELEAIFTRRLGGFALLPRIIALGEFADEDDPFGEDGQEPDELPPSVGETARRLFLARLVRAWAGHVAANLSPGAEEADLIPTSPGSAVALATELGRLIDSFETENVDWGMLVGLVPSEHDRIWDLTRDFLKIASQHWPVYLSDTGLIGAAERRNLHLRALAESIRAERPECPVVVAGSTGSIPATADLMAAVSRLPRGAVVLQGLDTDADDDTWREIGGRTGDRPASAAAWTHPQNAFHRLLERLDLQRGEIGHLSRPDVARDARRSLVSRALLPSERTETWASDAPRQADEALAGLTLVEAANEREEALAIAVALRETLEHPEHTVALVTPDRTLARRVAAELRRWNVEVEDSAGLPLAESRIGILARLLADAARDDLAPADVLALLGHPEAGFELEPAERRRGATALEFGALRGPTPPPGAAGLGHAIALARGEAREQQSFAHPARKALAEEDWDAASRLIECLHRALEPLCALGRGGREAPLHDLLVAHRSAIEAALGGEQDNPDWVTLAAFFDEADGAEAVQFTVGLADYPAVFRALLQGRAARPVTPGHPRLRILGTLEARLLGFDRLVLGGLVETVWPPQTVNDPFLSRPMRAALGLPPPEWRIGLAAHDFEMALGGPDVILTRALKSGGAPSVASRWVQRLAAVSGEAWKPVQARGHRYLSLARALDDAPVKRAGAPAPRPPLDLRPLRLSVTEVETLIRDPYAIYARHVLRLQPLEPVGVLPQASDRGTIIHGALSRFIEERDVFAPDAVEQLCAIGREAFEPFWAFPDIRALWWPRFQRIARWFVEWERTRRPGIAAPYTEKRGRLSWPLGTRGDFMLSGRADRLDRLASGSFAILDYKTGARPGDREVCAGFAPQLPLEGAILRHGAFEDGLSGEVEEYLYVRLTGGAQPGDAHRVDTDTRTPAELADEALAKLKSLMEDFEREEQPYRSHTYPKFMRGIQGTYDHLARYAEWSIAPESDEGSEA